MSVKAVALAHAFSSSARRHMRIEAGDACCDAVARNCSSRGINSKCMRRARRHRPASMTSAGRLLRNVKRAAMASSCKEASQNAKRYLATSDNGAQCGKCAARPAINGAKVVMLVARWRSWRYQIVASSNKCKPPSRHLMSREIIVIFYRNGSGDDSMKLRLRLRLWRREK